MGGAAREWPSQATESTQPVAARVGSTAARGASQRVRTA